MILTEERKKKNVYIKQSTTFLNLLITTVHQLSKFYIHVPQKKSSFCLSLLFCTIFVQLLKILNTHLRLQYGLIIKKFNLKFSMEPFLMICCISIRITVIQCLHSDLVVIFFCPMVRDNIVGRLVTTIHLLCIAKHTHTMHTSYIHMYLGVFHLSGQEDILSRSSSICQYYRWTLLWIEYSSVSHYYQWWVS